MRLVGEEENDGRILRGETVTLRPPRAGDAEARFGLGQDPAIARMYGIDPAKLKPWSREVAMDWVTRISNHDPAWIIDVDDQVVGDARLHGFDTFNGSASLAIGLADPARLGQGIGRQAVALILDHAFRTLGLHRVALRCLEINTRALRCYEACGFRREGVAREAVNLGGQWYDDILMAKLAQDHLR